MQAPLNKYVDWKDFFNKKLTSFELFHLNGHRKIGKITVEFFVSSLPGCKTTIHVGYESVQRLRFLRILNPFTPGLNNQQEKLNFTKNDFYPHLEQKGEGLEFDFYNLRGIDEYLSQGFEGSEVVYLRNGKPVKSILKSNTFLGPIGTLTIYFEKFVKEESYDQTYSIELNSVYPGTNLHEHPL
mgnify:CR=1 FL=1